MRAFLALAAVLAAACGNKIGDECKTNVDCSQEAERSCDISQPGGYCTIDGCDERTCPEDSVCIRFFPRQYLGAVCSPMMSACPPDELCLTEGRCAPRASERRYCAGTCRDDGDCRNGYECREAGTEGSLALTSNLTSRPRFCAPHGK